MHLWAQLQRGIKRHMDKRRFELLTFVAAHALRSTLCSLAHGQALTKFLPMEDVMAIARGEAPPSLSVAEAAMLVFARKVARDASSVTSGDVPSSSSSMASPMQRSSIFRRLSPRVRSGRK